MRAAALAALLALAGAPAPARAEGWTKTDVAVQAAFVAVALTDCVQTERLLDTGLFRERNPLLGPHPSDRKLALGCAVAIGSHTVVAAMLPKPWRRYWQAFGIHVEVSMVTTNFIAARWTW